MKLPLEITFRRMDSSPALEAKIREKAQKLERYHDHIMSCRVVVEAAHGQHRQGNLFQVRLDIKVPGKELAITRHHPKDHAHEDVYVALRDAFDAAARRLEECGRIERGEVKAGEGPPRGRVVSLDPDLDCGRIETPDGELIYFHRNSVLGGGFDSLEVGSEVRFSEEMGDKGLQASSVHPAGKG
ncbi:HPF/RaiA family ribosome-associated protein [Desulfurivibrio alkaliphilus]|uniref:Cold-shock protein DNA-binding protein n=1 Tax=Desulfurivibrio alkaliphilus (strain DSM 19089 / UNIQEM U267 / AHT2) TaxID=589865 RepID=D6Z301_DESAT|nr:HPF/RaiA family ribosome-associated protein [Desulfurivibrio alkaliphilus]ADH85926.1 Cold-shock protein DNA-binding protein [Desulfurivibrio alkaliphilus AHT 2]